CHLLREDGSRVLRSDGAGGFQGVALHVNGLRLARSAVSSLGNVPDAGEPSRRSRAPLIRLACGSRGPPDSVAARHGGQRRGEGSVDRTATSSRDLWKGVGAPAGGGP